MIPFDKGFQKWGLLTQLLWVSPKQTSHVRESKKSKPGLLCFRLFFPINNWIYLRFRQWGITSHEI